jgi:carbamate kinase
MVEVDTADPALARSEDAIGRLITGDYALAVTREKPYSPAHDRIGYRHAAPNPRPTRLLQARLLHSLVEQGTVVMCRGGGTPVVATPGGGVSGVRAFIDPYDCAALVAETIDADLFVIAMEMAGVILDWGTANSKLLRHGHPSALRELASTVGSMAPTLQAASSFVERTGRRAAIGALNDVARLVDGSAGTTISCERADPRRFEGGAVAY